MSQQKPTNRRAVLWNVQIPGDPYDIRKSMIARLPEHPARFMGDNLELVCLFQAAQIERLAQYLDEMTLEMRSLERIELDRHSYEVQIKELAQKLQLFYQSKQENNKLREFIKGQSQELQNLQKYRNSAQSLIELQTKYELVLNELRLSRQNYQALRKTNSDSLNELADLKYRYERLQSALKQERLSKQRQIKFSIQKSVAQTQHLYESQQYQLKGELNVMKENLALKIQEISSEKDKNSQLLRQLKDKEELIGRYMRGQIEPQSSNKTQEFLRISKRLEESTYLLEQKEKSIVNYKDQITYLNKRIKQLEQDLRKRQQEFRKSQQNLRKRQQELGRKDQQLRKREAQSKNRELEYNKNPQLLMKIAEFDKKIIIFSSEIDRLKEVLSVRERDILQREMQLSFYKQKNFVYEKNIEALQREISERENVIKRMDFQVKMVDNRDTKIQDLGNEVARLNIVLREKLNEITRLQSRMNQSRETESHYMTLIRTKEQAIRVLQSRNKQFQTKLNYCQQANKVNLDQINRVTLKLTTCENTNIQLRRQIDSKIHASSTEHAQIKIQFNSLTQEINQKLVQNKKLREDNQKMFAQINQFQRKIIQFQRKILIYQTTINQLRITNTQKLSDKQRIQQQLQASIKQKERNYLQKIQIYSKSVPKMSQQIDRLHQLLEKRQTQSKKIQDDYKTLQDNYKRLQIDFKRVQQELQIQRERARINERRNSTQVQIKILQYERSIAFYESKCKNYEKVNDELTEQRNKVNGKILSLENQLRESHSQLDKILQVIKSKQLSLEQYQKRSSLSHSTISQLRQQNLKLQGESLKFRQQLQLHLQLIKKLNYQLDVHKRDLSATMNSYSNIKEEYSKLRVVFEQKEMSKPGLKHTIDQLRHTIDELRHKLAKAQNQVNYLTHQLNQRKKHPQSQQQSINHLKLKLSQYQDSIKHTQQVNSVRIEQLRHKMLQQFDLHLKKQANRYQQLQQAYTELQMNYQNKSVYFQDQSGKIQTMDARIQALQTQDQQLRQLLQQYQQKVLSYEERIALISQEIQRLTMENNSYKQKNNSITQQNDSYNQENKRLKIKLQQLIKVQQGTRQQLQQLNRQQTSAQSIAELNNQLSLAKTQLMNLKQMVQEYESINQHTIAQRDELFAITHEQETKMAQYQLEVNTIINQLNSTRNELNIKERQLQSIRGSVGVSSELNLVKEQYTLIHNQYGILEQEYNRVISELQSAKKRISQQSASTTNQRDFQAKQLQIKIHQITQHYQNALRTQQFTIKQYQKRIFEYQQRSKGYQQRIQGYQQSIEQFLTNMNIFQRQNNQLKNKVQQLQHELSSERQIQEQIEELKTEYINIKMQNQELNRMLEEMQEQLFESNEDRKRLNLQVNQFNLRVNDYNQQNNLLAQLQSQNTQLKHTIQQQRTGIQTLRQKLSLLSTQIDQIRSQAQTKIQSLNSQYTALSSSHISLQQQNMALKQQVQSLQLEITQVSVYQEISQELETKYNLMYATYEEAYRVYNEMKLQAETVRGNLHNAQARIQLLNQEFDKINLMVVQLRNQLLEARTHNQRLKQQLGIKQTQLTHIITTNADLQAELKRMYQVNQDLTKQLKQTRLRLTDQHALEQKIKHYMFLFVIMSAQIQSLRKRVLESQQQCEDVRRNSISPIKTKK